MRIATWNINGAKARLEGALTWLKETNPDVACFQEIKSSNEAFPAAFFEELGYHVAVHGQKGFNGVAVLSKRRFDEVVVRGLPGDDGDAHARYIEVMVPNGSGIVRIGNLYLPNGNPIGTDRFAYKLAWMRRFEARVRELLGLEEVFLLMGDYNVIPEPADAKNPDAWRLVSARDARGLPCAHQSGADGCGARLPARGRHLHLLGLPGRRLAEGPRHSHRPHFAVTAGGRSTARRRHRQVHPRLGKALRSCSRLGRTAGRLAGQARPA
jgi:hypothetical protein